MSGISLGDLAVEAANNLAAGIQGNGLQGLEKNSVYESLGEKWQDEVKGVVEKAPPQPEQYAAGVRNVLIRAFVTNPGLAARVQNVLSKSPTTNSINIAETASNERLIIGSDGTVVISVGEPSPYEPTPTTAIRTRGPIKFGDI
jgi:hypothetical protein